MTSPDNTPQRIANKACIECFSHPAFSNLVKKVAAALREYGEACAKAKETEILSDPYVKAMRNGIEEGTRRAALEEAAKIAEISEHYNCADQIRALMENK
jgi:hypothetical protein